jgi:hypothetical protein
MASADLSLARASPQQLVVVDAELMAFYKRCTTMIRVDNLLLPNVTILDLSSPVESDR